MDGRHLPPGPDRADPGSTYRARLTADRPGRLPPERMYPAGEEGIAVRRVALRDGVSLRVLECRPAAAAAVARQPYVLLLHGWSGSVYSFAETIPALRAAGFHVIAPDLPGHGLSDKPLDPAWYSLSALADVVSATLAACGVQRYGLVAHSFGGAIALELASRRDGAPERMALIAAVGLGRVPLAAVARTVTPAAVAPWIPAFLTRGFVRVVLNGAFGTGERPVERDVDQYWAPTQFNAFGLAARICLHRASFVRAPEALLRGLRMPVLVIAGGRDRIVRHSAAGGRLIPGARVVAVPEAGHLVLQERADVTNRALLEFLKG